MKEVMLIIFILALNRGYSQKIEPFFIEGVNLNELEVIRSNKISEELIYSYTLEKNGSVRDSVIARAFKFLYDSNGNISHKIEFNANNSKQFEYDYYYDELNRISKKIGNPRSPPAIPLNLINQYQYDSAGNLIFEYNYNQDTTSLRIEQNIYDEHNRLVEIRTKINFDDFYKSRAFDYNPNGKLTKGEAFDNKERWMYSNIYEYSAVKNSKTEFLENSDGRRFVSETIYNADNKPVQYRSIHADVHVLNNSLFSDTVTQIDEYSYNHDGTINSWSVKSDGKLVRLYKYYYKFN